MQTHDSATYYVKPNFPGGRKLVLQKPEFTRKQSYCRFQFSDSWHFRQITRMRFSCNMQTFL